MRQDAELAAAGKARNLAQNEVFEGIFDLSRSQKQQAAARPQQPGCGRAQRFVDANSSYGDDIDSSDVPIWELLKPYACYCRAL